MNRKSSIIVVNWNGKRFREGCLSALLAQTYSPYEIILVDNGSRDGSVDFVAERFPEVRIIENGENLGFAAGNNVAIRVARGDYIVTLNNDTRAELDCLEELVKVVETDPKIGMCASKMLFCYHTGVLNSTGISLDVAGIAWDRRGGERDDGLEREPLEIFGPCVGAALYRREMLDEVGLFDEDFFAYHEDVGLAWRARSRGWRCMHVQPASRRLSRPLRDGPGRLGYQKSPLGSEQGLDDGQKLSVSSNLSLFAPHRLL